MADKFGHYWELTDDISSVSGQTNLNSLIPMGFPFRRATDALLSIRINGINWQKTDATLLELPEQSPLTLTDNATNYIYFDTSGTLTLSTVSFPAPASNESFLCAKIVTNLGSIITVFPYIRPST